MSENSFTARLPHAIPTRRTEPLTFGLLPEKVYESVPRRHRASGCPDTRHELTNFERDNGVAVTPDGRQVRAVIALGSAQIRHDEHPYRHQQ